MLTWLEGKEVVVVSSPSLASVLVLLLEQKLGYREGEAKGEYGKVKKKAKNNYSPFYF